MYIYHNITILRFQAISLSMLIPCFVIAAINHEGTGFDRYSVILDRKPFGEVSPSEAPVTLAVASLVKDLKMQAIIDDGRNIRVGFLNKKNNENIYLSVGETINGIELVSVNYDDEESTVRMGNETLVFSLRPDDKTQSEKVSSSKKASRTRRRPFFTKLKGTKAKTLQQIGQKLPFRGETIENFLKKYPEAALQYPSPIRSSDSTNPAVGRGETIERFLSENPDAIRRFSPIQAPPITLPSGDNATTMEQFLQEHAGEMRYIQPPTSIPFPALQEESVETFTQ